MRPPGHLMAMPDRRTKICSPFLVLLSYLIWKSPTGIISCSGLFSAQNKKAVLISFDRCILGSERGVGRRGAGADPIFPLFFHENPTSRTSLVAITNIVFFLDPAGVEISLTNTFLKLLFHWSLTCTTYCFRRKGHCYVTSLLFSHPITNLVCNRCRFSGKS